MYSRHSIKTASIVYFYKLHQGCVQNKNWNILAIGFPWIPAPLGTRHLLLGSRAKQSLNFARLNAVQVCFSFTKAFVVTRKRKQTSCSVVTFIGGGKRLWQDLSASSMTDRRWCHSNGDQKWCPLIWQTGSDLIQHGGPHMRLEGWKPSFGGNCSPPHSPFYIYYGTMRRSC